MRRDGCIPTIVDDLYAGAMDDVAWRRALIGITDLVGGASYHLFAVNPSSGAILHDESGRVDPGTIHSYRNYWSLRDPRTGAALAVGEGIGMFDEMIMPIRVWRRSEIYNDFLLDRGIPYFIAYWLQKAAEKVVAFSLQGTQGRGPFDGRDDELLQPLMPHLKRALDIRSRLAMQQVRADSLAGCLDRLHCAVFVLDDCARIIDANAVAEFLLRTETVLRRETDKTLWLRGEAGLELQRRVYAGTPPAYRDTVLLHRADGRLPLSLLITPLPEIVSWSAPQPRWLVMMFDQEQRQRLSAQALSVTLNITEREAQLVVQLASHCNLAHAATRLGISLHTARSHLKSIFSKTGVRSQAELVSRVLGGLAAAPR